MPSPRSRAHGSLLNGIGQGDASVAVDEETRNEVFEAFKVSHGAKIAGALLEMLPSAGVPELATKADLALVRTEMGALEARLGERIESALTNVQRELRDQTGRFIGWMFAGLGLAVAAGSTIARLG